VVQFQQTPTIRQYQDAGQPVFQYIPAGQPINLGATYAQLPNGQLMNAFQYTTDGQSAGLRGEEVIMTINMVQDENGEMRMAEPITTSTRPVPANTSISINPPPTINISPVNLTPQQLINNITTPLVSVSQPSTTTPTTVISSQGQTQPTEPHVEPSNLEEEEEESMLEPESSLPDNWRQEMTERFVAEDANYDLILEYMKTKEVPPEFKDKTVRRKVNRHMQHLVQDSNGVLHYIHTRSQTWRLVVRDAEKAEEVLSDHHVDPLTGFHCCARTLANKIKQNFYWRQIELDSTNYVKACKICVQAGVYQGGSVAYNVKAEDGFIFREMGPVTNKKVFEAPKLKVENVLDLVGINVIGPLPPASTGLRHVLAVTDYHSLWVEFIPLYFQDSAVHIAAGIRSFLFRFGPPKKLFYESKTDFIDDINAELKVKMKVELIAPFSPETAQAARDRKLDLKKRLEDLVEEKEDGWEMALEETAYELRLKQRNGTTPFFSMLNRHPNK